MASSLWSSLRSLLGLTSNWQRKSSSWVFGLTSTSQLQQFVPSGYLVAEWGHASPSVLCSDDHPAYIRYNTTSQQLVTTFSSLALDLDGGVIVSIAQKKAVQQKESE